MTVGIDFCIANTRREAASAEKYVKFDEKLHHYLLEKEGDPAKRFGLLLNLDEYGDRLFSSREINELINICENLLSEYSFTTDKPWEVDKVIQGINAFAKELKALCLEALDQNKEVYAVGD